MNNPILPILLGVIVAGLIILTVMKIEEIYDRHFPQKYGAQSHLYIMGAPKQSNSTLTTSYPVSIGPFFRTLEDARKWLKNHPQTSSIAISIAGEEHTFIPAK